MFEKVKRKLLEYCEYPEGQLTEDTEIYKDLQINSLDIMLMLGDLEDEFDIHFEQEEIINIVTVGDVVNLMLIKINNK